MLPPLKTQRGREPGGVGAPGGRERRGSGFSPRAPRGGGPADAKGPRWTSVLWAARRRQLWVTASHAAGGNEPRRPGEGVRPPSHPTRGAGSGSRGNGTASTRGPMTWPACPPPTPDPAAPASALGQSPHAVGLCPSESTRAPLRLTLGVSRLIGPPLLGGGRWTRALPVSSAGLTRPRALWVPEQGGGRRWDVRRGGTRHGATTCLWTELTPG